MPAGFSAPLTQYASPRRRLGQPSLRLGPKLQLGEGYVKRILKFSTVIAGLNGVVSVFERSISGKSFGDIQKSVENVTYSKHLVVVPGGVVVGATTILELFEESQSAVGRTQ